MKKWKNPFLIFLCAAMLLGMLASCGGGAQPMETESTLESATTDDPSEVQMIPVSALSDYIIIYAGNMDHSKISSALSDLIKTIKARYGMMMDIRDDYVREGSIYSVREHEILIGTTNREESQTVCAGITKANDYEIRLFGKKLVIAGITEEAVVSAINVLIGKMGNTDSETFFESVQNVRFIDQYELDDLTIDGTSVSEYTVVYKSESAYKTLSQQIVAAIRSRCGYPLPMQSELKGAPSGKCIFVGISSDQASGVTEQQYYLGIHNGNLYVYGGTIPMVYKATDAAINAIGKATRQNQAISVSNGAVAATDTSLVAMSFNILCDKRTDSRDEAVIDTIRRNHPDTFGVQEATPSWMTLLKSTFGDEYDVVGEGRNGGNSGEYSAVFYRKSRFNLIASGTQWLSETPTVKGSKMAGAAYPRVFSYAVLECKDTGRRFIHVNTHTDHVPDDTVDGDAVRLKQVQVITDFLKQNYPNLPTIISGDLNDQKTAKSIQYLLNAGYDHCADIALSSDSSFTFSSRVIDYLLYSHDDFFLYEYMVDTAVYTGGLNGRSASDHNAITVRYDINAK